MEKGWLRGPFKENELAEMLGPLFVVSRRFGIWQNDKIRLIDDLSESLVNLSFGCGAKVNLGGADEVALLARALVAMVGDDRTVSVKLNDGSTLAGILHSSLTVVQAKTLVGRTLDLEGAYKQLLVAESSLWASVIQVLNADTGEYEWYVCEVLPFGASAAVLGFNRFSRAIWKIGVRLFDLLWCNYFDDYPHLHVKSAADGALRTAEKLMNLVGWVFAKSGAKRLPFSDVFDPLGVRIDLSESAKGRITVANKPGRIESICERFEGLLQEKRCSSAEASSLMGVMQFAEGQLYARMGAVRMPMFRARAAGKGTGTAIPAGMIDEMIWACWFLKQARPRTVLAKDTRPPLLVFTDAALEGEGVHATIGGVVVDGDRAEIFGKRLSDQQRSILQKETMRIICCLEVLPVVAVVKTWRSAILHRRVFFFVDNDAAKFSLINHQSESPSIRHMLLKLSGLLADTPFFPWYMRVPSASSPGDAPSRGERLAIFMAFVQVVSVDIDWLFD